MKLYTSNGACSMSPQIVAAEAGLPVTIETVDLRTHTLPDGRDYYAINPKGAVPALELDDGSVLTEGPAIVQFLADQAPASGLAPANGTVARYRLQEWLNFITSEVHKSLSVLFDKSIPAEFRAATMAKVGKRFEWIEQQLGAKPYLMGDAFSAADAYLFTLLSWHDWLHFDLAQWPGLQQYFERVKARPKVAGVLHDNHRTRS
ncbi:MAG: glutathione transferase GstA [Proteobacteria bacterium]|nr:glutathione transferase GstA [Pseudomonadota bacterium]